MENKVFVVLWKIVVDFCVENTKELPGIEKKACIFLA